MPRSGDENETSKRRIPNPGAGRRALPRTTEAAERPRVRLHPADRRALILDAAAEAFGRDGYDGVSVDTIAGAAGVTKPVLYRHFDSKEALYLALLDRHREDMPGFVSRFPGDLPLPELVNSILNIWFGYAEENGHGWRMLFRDSGGTEAIRESRERMYEEARAVLGGFLVVHPAFDVGAAEIDATAEAVRGALSSLVLFGQEHPAIERESLVGAGTRLIVGLAS